MCSVLLSFYMTAGRPTLHDAEHVAKQTAAYIGDCHTNYYQPTVEGLAVHLEVDGNTVYRWADEHDEFRHFLEAPLAAQASQFIQNGLKNEYNPTITKLMLTKHGYSDKQEVDHTSKGSHYGFQFREQ